MAADRYRVGGLLGLVALLPFVATLQHGFITLDDGHLILRNPGVVAPLSQPLSEWFLTTHVGYVVPVTVWFQALLFALGTGALAFHFASLLLHGVAAVLVMQLGRALGAGLAASAVAALCFAWHPIVVEPVAWATGQKDLLMACFALGGTLALLRDRPDWMIACGVLATLSKPTGALVGAAWCAYLGRSALGDRRLRAAVIALVVGVAALGLGYLLHHDLIPDPHGRMAGRWQMPLALGHTLGHLLWPVDLGVLYWVDRQAALSDVGVLAGFGAMAAGLALAWRWRRWPPGVLALGLAALSWLPVSGLIPNPRVLADSYAYLPWACAATLLALAATRWPRVIPVLAAAAVLLAWGSVRQVPRWASDEAMFAPIAQRHPDWDGPALQVSRQQLEEGRADDAVATLQRFFAHAYDPGMLGNLARALMKAERLRDAECVMVEAIHQDSGGRYNHGALLLTHPEYETQWPGEARLSLAHVAELHGRGELPWPDEVLARIAPAAQALAAAAPPKRDWPRRSCQVLAAP